MRILCIDHGDRRIGLAVSDALGLTAQALGVLDLRRTGNPIEEIVRIVREKEIGEIVVGVPYNMDGSEGPRADAARKFMERLRAAVDVPVVGFDERLSTAQAQRAMLMGDLSRAKRKKRADKLAAQIVLQTYLERRRHRDDGQ